LLVIDHQLTRIRVRLIMELIEVKIGGLALDVTTNSPVITLSPIDSKKILPIWIGHYEAWAIGMEMSGVISKRPLTHDLLFKIIADMGGEVEKIVVTELKEQTFYARIYIKMNGNVLEIDARPSDSIALALKAKSPIFVNSELFQLKDEKISGIPDQESLRDRLRRMNPEDFGNYQL
jgi:bifunctional DNase/RNase